MSGDDWLLQYSDAVLQKADELFHDRYGRYPKTDGSDDGILKSICDEVARSNFFYLNR
jgi:hypothetical protein